MIENLEFRNLHLKASGSSDGPARAVRCSSTPENPNLQELEGRIPRILQRGPCNLPAFSNKRPRDYKPFIAEGESGSPGFSGNIQPTGDVRLTFDASPHSPWITFSDQEGGSGGWPLGSPGHLNVEVRRNWSHQRQNQNPCIQNFENGNIGSEGSPGLRVCKKILNPAIFPSLGTLGGRNEQT